jgi:hypothetical protein
LEDGFWLGLPDKWREVFTKARPILKKNSWDLNFSRNSNLKKFPRLYFFLSRKKILRFFFSRFLGLTSQNNFATLNSIFFSRFTYLEFFPPPILAQKSRDFLPQGNLEISCLSRYGPETLASRNHVLPF